MDDPEAPLRAHIRRLLLDYCMEHLTVDYLEYTETVVSKILSTFRPVLETDPTSLFLPVDPWTVLSNKCSLLNLPPYDEILEADSAGIALFKQLAIFRKAPIPKSQAVVESQPPAWHPPWHPDTPMLSRKARRETPILGTSYKQRAPSTFEDISLTPVSKDYIPKIRLNADEVLNVELSLSSSEMREITQLLRQAASREPKFIPQYLQRCYLPPLPDPVKHEEIFAPLFPRQRDMSERLVPRLGDMLKSVPVPSEEPLWNQNLRIVDGWEAITSSPASSWAASESSDEEVDQLAADVDEAPSLPSTLLKKLDCSPIQTDNLAFGIDVPMMPRSRCLGVSLKERVNSIFAHDQLLSTLLSPLVSPVEVVGTDTNDLTNLSTLAELSTAPDEDSILGDLANFLPSADSTSLIVEEGLDSVDDAFLPVPILPPPLTCHAALHETDNFLGFLTACVSQAPLKKVKGLQALTIALGWSPFVARGNEYIPTIEEACNVEELLSQSEQDELRCIPRFIKLSDPESLVPPMDCGRENAQWKSFDCLSSHVPDINDQKELLLTRLERKRRDGIGTLPDLQRENGTSKSLKRKEDESIGVDEPSKRKRFEPLAGLTKAASLCTQSTSPRSNFEFSHLDEGDASEKENLPPGTPNLLESHSPPIRFGPGGRRLRPFGTTHDILDIEDGESIPMDTVDSSNSAELCHEQEESLQLHHLDVLDDHRDFDPLSFVESKTKDTTSLSRMLERSATTTEEVPGNPVLDFPFLSQQMLGVNMFAQLRDLPLANSSPHRPESPLPSIPTQGGPSNQPKISRESLYDHRTMLLPERSVGSRSPHSYFASVPFIQKQAVVRELKSHTSVDLVEREALGGADIILDPFASILTVSLFLLPSRVTNVLQLLCTLSWSYERILVIFEGYPEKRAKKYPSGSEDTAHDPYPYSPPIVKAIRRLRRELAVYETQGLKNSACSITFAFSDNVHETAQFVRAFGDLLEKIDLEEGSQGVLWGGGREWLDGELPEDESDLAALDGMNHFAAYTILCQIGAQDFIDMDPQHRKDRFGPLIGLGRVDALNSILGSRQEELKCLDEGNPGPIRQQHDKAVQMWPGSPALDS